MKKPHIRSGSITRGMKAQRAYHKHRKKTPSTTDCTFCEFNATSPQLIAEHPLFWHVENIFPYSIWDESPVVKHTMIVPKRHVVSLSEFTAEEATEYFKLISHLEKKGSSIYSRSDMQASKSVAHQHTHAIKTKKKHIKTLYFNSAPHILWYK